MNGIRQKLLATFQGECGEHIGRIRALLPGLERGGEGLDDAFRHAHSLKGAARAVDLRPVERLAHRMETLFSRVRDGALSLNGETAGVVHRVLDAVEDWMAALGENRTPPEPALALAAVEKVLGVEPETAPQPPGGPEAGAAIPQTETVRVDAGNLDRLLRSAGQLLAEGVRQDLVTQQLGRLSGEIARLEREWDRVRETSAGPLRRLSGTPEFAGLVRALDSAERHARLLSGQVRAVRRLQQQGSRAIRQLGEQLREDARQARMTPAASVFEGFRRMVRDLARDEGKEVEFQASGLEVEADRVVLQALKDPLMHLLRNAVSHGIEPPRGRADRGKDRVGHVALRVEAQGNRLRISVEDDGHGIDLRRVAEAAVRRGLLSEPEAGAAPPREITRLIFQPGFTTSETVTDLAGRGMGLSVVHEAVTRLQGEVEVQQREGGGTSVLLSVPLSISAHRLLLVACQGQRFGIPTHGVERLHRVRVQDVETVEGRPVIRLGEKPVPLVSLARLLRIEEPGVSPDERFLPVVALKSGDRRLAVTVEGFLSVVDGLVLDVKAPGEGADRLAGGILMEDGSVCLALNPSGLVNGFRAIDGAPALKMEKRPSKQKSSTVLVVDDSITTRTLEKSILEAHGYCVQVAVDGADAMDRLRSEAVDLIVADLQMPRMDGFALLKALKEDPRLSRIPVILVTSMERREDQERGLALGADAYIVKRKFDQRELLDAIEQML